MQKLRRQKPCRKEAEATAAAQAAARQRQLRHQLRQAQAVQLRQYEAAMQVQREPDHLHIRYREQRLPVALADVWHRLQVQQPVMTESIMVQDTEQQFMRLIPVPLLPHKYNSARGNYIVINHGNGMQTWYQHLSSMNVTGTDGQEVR